MFMFRGRGRGGFNGIFEIVAADKATGGVGRKETHLPWGIEIIALAGPSPPLLLDRPAPSLLAQEGEGGGERWSIIALVN